jgi:hypothetical protein
MESDYGSCLSTAVIKLNYCETEDSRIAEIVAGLERKKEFWVVVQAY